MEEAMGVDRVFFDRRGQRPGAALACGYCGQTLPPSKPCFVCEVTMRSMRAWARTNVVQDGLSDAELVSIYAERSADK
jgi:hypothetical protein